jgi:hypothetical protein
MNFKTTIALIVVLAGLGGYLFYTRSTTPSSTPAPTEARKLIDIKSDQVTKLSIAPTNGNPTTFEKHGSDWQITSPIQAAADDSKVDELLTTILGLESKGQLDASQKSANGLDHPDYTIAITTADKTARLLVGDKPPIGSTLAVLLDGADKPDVVDVSLFTSLDKKAAEFRKTHLIAASSDQIQQIQITRGKETLRLEKNGADWSITAPRTMPADSTAVENILSAITNLNAAGFDDIDTPAEVGLARPRATVWFSTTPASTQPTTAPTSQPPGVTLKLGGFEDISQKNVFASVDDGPIVTVPASTLDSFKKTPIDLRDKNLVNIDPDRVESVTLEVDRAASVKPPILPEHHVFHIERRKQTAAPLGPTLSTQPASTSVWMLKGDGDANDSAVTALLNALHPLHADSLTETSPSATQPTGTVYSLTVQTGPSAGSPPAQYFLRLTDPGIDQKLTGSYEDLTFQLDHAVITSFQAEFKAGK